MAGLAGAGLVTAGDVLFCGGWVKEEGALAAMGPDLRVRTHAGTAAMCMQPCACGRKPARVSQKRLSEGARSGSPGARRQQEQQSWQGRGLGGREYFWQGRSAPVLPAACGCHSLPLAQACMMAVVAGQRLLLVVACAKPSLRSAAVLGACKGTPQPFWARGAQPAPDSGTWQQRLQRAVTRPLRLLQASWFSCRGAWVNEGCGSQQGG